MRNRAGVVVVAVAVGVLAIGAGGSSKAERVRDALTSAIEADVASDPAIPGEIVTVRAPGVDETVATGFADVDAQVPLEPGTPFRVASMTKTTTLAIE